MYDDFDMIQADEFDGWVDEDVWDEFFEDEKG